MDAPGGESDALARRVAELQWYHTLELAPGVVTPGWFDLRATVDAVGFPVSLDGLRCLDVGTFDGFWAFEMERRGANEIVAIDVLDPDRWEWPADSPPDAVTEIARRTGGGAGFELARMALGSSVQRRELSVYEVDRETVGGFDFVYLGSLLLHLRDPVGALQRVRSVCDGRLLVVDAVDLGLGALFPRRPVASLDAVGRPWWWKPNVAGVLRMLQAAGFEREGRPKRVFLPAGRGQLRPARRWRALRHKPGRDAVLRSLVGDPHVAVFARPR